MHKLKTSFYYAFRGLIFVFRTQRNMRIHFFVALVVYVLAWLLDFELMEILAVTVAIFLVLIAETFNTALEKVVDLYTKNYDPLARITKNVAAAAVLLASFFAILVGLVVFGARLLSFIN